MEYTIQVFRPMAMPPSGTFNQGFLKFEHGNTRINTPCWWADKRVVPGVYLATATRMGTSKRESIWLKRKVRYPSYIPYNLSPHVALPLPTDNWTDTALEIFIHEGTHPGKSDGCIVAAEAQVVKIWEQIPKDEDNILVHVYDYEPIATSGPIPTM